MKTLLIPILGLTILAAGAPIALAEEHHDHERQEHHEEHEDFDEEEYEEHEEGELLERNVRIDFQLLPLEDEDDEVFVVTSVSWFSSHVEFSNEDVRIEFHASGHIEVLDDDEFLIAYEVGVGYATDSEEAEMHAEAAARLTPGQPLKAASMGDKTLVISVSYADDQPQVEE